MNKVKWRLSSIFTVTLAVFLIILAPLVGYCLFIFGVTITGLANPASVFAKIGYLLFFCAVLIPLILLYFAYRNFKCTGIEMEVELKRCFSSAKQRKKIIITTVIDFFLAVVFLSLAIAALFSEVMAIEILLPTFIIACLISVVSVATAICKIPIVKFPVIPPYNAMPDNYPVYPWNVR